MMRCERHWSIASRATVHAILARSFGLDGAAAADASRTCFWERAPSTSTKASARQRMRTARPRTRSVELDPVAERVRPVRRGVRAGVTAASTRGWLMNPVSRTARPGSEKRPADRRARVSLLGLSAAAGELLGLRSVLGRREEPPRYKSGFRGQGSNHRFHRLPRHTVLPASWDQTSPPSALRHEDSRRSGVAAQAARDTVL
jgi:hypothetical protein